MLPDNEFEKTSLEFQLVYGEPLDHREPLLLVDDGSTSENPVAEFLSKVEDEQSLLKNGGSVLDSTWSEELGTPPRIADGSYQPRGKTALGHSSGIQRGGVKWRLP
jgi:hypothetical protein